MANAKRRSRPWKKIACASMKVPMNRKMSGSANGANASLAGATPSTTAAATPRNAVIAIGIASVTHRTTTAASTAASRWAGGSRPPVVHQTTAKASGAPARPARRRHRSRRPSMASAAASSGGRAAGSGRGAVVPVLLAPRPGARQTRPTLAAADGHAAAPWRVLVALAWRAAPRLRSRAGSAIPSVTRPRVHGGIRSARCTAGARHAHLAGSGSACGECHGVHCGGASAF